MVLKAKTTNTVAAYPLSKNTPTTQQQQSVVVEEDEEKQQQPLVVDEEDTTLEAVEAVTPPTTPIIQPEKSGKTTSHFVPFMIFFLGVLGLVWWVSRGESSKIPSTKKINLSHDTTFARSMKSPSAAPFLQQ